MFRTLYYSLRLFTMFLIELMLANVVVARTILQPRLRIRPGIIAYNTELRTRTAVAWLANLITLTPGTLTLYLDDDHRTLYIHTLNVDDPDTVIEGIRRAFERSLLELEK